MQQDEAFRAMELRLFWQCKTRLGQTQDEESISACLADLEGIRRHTEQNALRQRCDELIARYQTALAAS